MRFTVPESAPRAKIAQLLIFGAQVLCVRGSYDQAFDLSLAATRRWGWYSRSTAFNPYLSEGKKTVSLEICEQLGFEAPDRIYVPVGDGCIIGGVEKGLRDLKALGLIERMPRVVGVQAEGSAAIANAFATGTEQVAPVEPTTLADSISVGRPRDAIKALRAVRRTGGMYVKVSDEEILSAMRLLGHEAGVFAEPAGSTALAGLLKQAREGSVGRGERAVVIVSGSGLKDVDSAVRAAPPATTIDPSEEAMAEAVAKLGLAGI